MAEAFDTSARLAEGLPGVADIESYVAACRALGYQHPELTNHGGQVRDWYVSEDGMNLRALDADCAAMQAVSVIVGEAFARQDAQRATLAAAWQGAGAQASRAFLLRHAEASADTVAAVRTGAHALADLRDRLWRAVDDKVATVLMIADGVQPRRGEWLAAAQTVTTGSGDRAVASELVDQEVKPFVDNVIGGQWLSAMRTAAEAIEAAYEGASAELASGATTTFEVPGELGPSGSSDRGDGMGTAAPAAGVAPASSAPAALPGRAVTGSSAAPVTPAGWSPSAAPPAASFAGPPAAAAPAPAGPAPLDAGAGSGTAAPSAPSLGGGLPDIGSGLSSFGQQLGDLFGGLLGGGGLDRDALGVDEPHEFDDLDESDEPGERDELDDLDEAEDLDDPDNPDDVVHTEGGPESEESEQNSEEMLDDADTDCPPQPPAAVPVDVPPEEPAATPPPAEPVTVSPERLAVAPDPPAEPQGGTPCEIAADELPQVGE